MYKLPTKLICLSLSSLLAFSLAGCGNTQISKGEKPNNSATNQSSSEKDSQNNTDADAAFETFCNDMFKTEIVKSTVQLHYTLSDPSAFGIDDYPITIGDFTREDFETSLDDIDNYLSSLKDIDYNALSNSNKVTYDILNFFLQSQRESEDFYLYNEVLSPTTGDQAQIPVIMAEYDFYSTKDIEDYLELLSLIPTYYEQVVEFEKEKSEAGLFMSDTSVDDIVAQCEDYISSVDDNVLITTFNERLDSFNGNNTTGEVLTAEDISAYETQNSDIVINEIIPSYENLIYELTALKGSGCNDGGLCNLPLGSSYYEYLVKTGTGSSWSVGDIYKKVKKNIDSDFNNLVMMTALDGNLWNEIIDPAFSLTEPEDILEDLREKIKEDFPDCPDGTYTVKYVDESLQEYLSPAFYMIPAVDKIDENVIYINPASSGEDDLYNTLAHEGYPGHLYQTTYFAATNPLLLRNLLDFEGYVEGWATYAEFYSYSLSDLDTGVASALSLYNSFTLGLLTYADIGVNYYSWTKADLSDVISEYLNITDEYIDNVYAYVCEEPETYLNYYVGYMEFDELYDTAKAALESDFNVKDFHEVVLNVGPAPFDIVEEQVNSWIESR